MRTISTSPHFHSGVSTQKIMLYVIIAMLPACGWGVYVFGFRALIVLAVSVLSSVLTEFILNLVSKERTLWDLSAVVTGLLIGMNMSPSVSLFIPVVASVFAIAVAKWTFGGLGCNWANPGIVGRIFVFYSFTSTMSSFPYPKTLGDTLVASASPLSIIKTAISSNEAVGMKSTEILASQGYAISEFASKLSSKIGINPYDIDAFVGNIPGCIGEVSKLLLLVGAIFLLATKVITWHIPVAFIGTFSLLTWIFGGIPYEMGLFTGEIFSPILRGGVILGAFYMATDMVTCPITRKGMFIFGVGCGFFTFLFRSFGSLPEATSVAILMMNMLSPTIDKFVKPTLFGSKEVIK